MIGLLLMVVIVVPVIGLIIASIFGNLRTKIPGLFIGSLILLIGAFILALAVGGAILGLIVPG